MYELKVGSLRPMMDKYLHSKTPNEEEGDCGRARLACGGDSRLQKNDCAHKYFMT